MFGNIIQYIGLIVQTDPGLESIEYIFVVDLFILESWDAIGIEQLQNIDLLGIESLPCCLPLKLVHHKFVIVDFSSDVLQRFVVDVEKFDILRFVRN